MSITIAGYILIIYVIYVFIKQKDADMLLIKLFAINLYLEGFVNIGHFMSVGTTTFNFSDFLQVVMAWVSLFVYVKKREKSTGPPVRLFIFFSIILLNLISMEVFPYDKLVRTFYAVDRVNNIAFMHYPTIDIQVLKTAARIFIFIWNACAVAKAINQKSWEEIKHTFIKFGLILIGWSWIDFVLRNFIGFNSFTVLLNTVFGNDSSIMNAEIRNNLNVIVGLNNEPSQFAMTLAHFMLFYIISDNSYKLQKKYNYIVASSIGVMLFSGSFRLIGLIPIIVIIYMIKNNIKLKFIALTALLFIILSIIYKIGFMDYYLQRLNNALLFVETNDATIKGGEAGRLNTLVEAFNVFLDRPIMGIGPGATFAFGFIPSILSMMGIAGTAAWYGIMFGNIGRVQLSAGLKHIKQELMILTLSVMWIYTKSIDVAYSIVVLGLVIEFRSQNGYLTKNDKTSYINNDYKK